MASQTRRALIAAASAMGLAAGSAAGAEKFEKPPGVPPEVDTAKVVCPNLTGPTYGYYATRWRVLPTPIEVGGPIEILPTIPKSTGSVKPNDGVKDKSGPKRSAPPQPILPVAPVRHETSAASPPRPVVVEVMPSATPQRGINPSQGTEKAITIDGKAVNPAASTEPRRTVEVSPMPQSRTKSGCN
jgi:hypothetical protein